MNEETIANCQKQQTKKIYADMPALILIDNHTKDSARVVWLDNPLDQINSVFSPTELITVEVLRWFPYFKEPLSQTERIVKNLVISAYEAQKAAEGYNIETTCANYTGVRLRDLDIDALATISQLFELSINGEFHYHRDTIKPLIRWKQPTVISYGITGRNFWLNVE